MKIVFLVIGILIYGSIYSQNNLLDVSTWEIGTESPEGFDNNGTDAENNFEQGLGPNGQSELLWSVYPDQSNGSDGGWITDYVSFDPSKTYRFTLWIKKTGTTNGTNYFGFTSDDGMGQNTALSLNGNVVNAYFFTGDLPAFGEWYLLVGFVHESGYGSTTHEGGVYDITGAKVANGTDFKFATSALRLRQRIYSNGNFESDRIYFYDPTIYEVNGLEPNVQQLISGTDTQAPIAPTLSSIGQTSTTTNLSWSGATDNVGVTGYKIYKEGSLEATLGNVSTYQVMGLTASTTYSFTIRAVDAAANESPLSNAVSVTTDAGSGGGTGGPVWSESGSVASYAGDVAIGTSTVPSGYKLAVEGKVRAREIRVDQDNWPDYVFKDGYELTSLEEIQRHIKEKGHLPNIPSARDVETNGVELGEMNRLLLEKIEELTLYIIQQDRKMDRLESMIIKNNGLQKQAK